MKYYAFSAEMEPEIIYLGDFESFDEADELARDYDYIYWIFDYNSLKRFAETANKHV